jgi:hypothetical protein
LHEDGVPSAVAQALIGHDSEAMYEVGVYVQVIAKINTDARMFLTSEIIFETEVEACLLWFDWIARYRAGIA